jgi:ATP-dependent Clp endopeptidase proteolytic subunit ClpP
MNDQERTEMADKKLDVAIKRLKLKSEREYQRRKAADASAARIYTFTAGVNSDTVARAIDTVGQWVREDRTRPVEVVFNSPGGAVFAGLGLYDFLRLVDEAGTPVTTTATGYAASMGGVLLQAGSTRRMTPNAWLMIHEVSSIAIGKSSELADNAELSKRLYDQLVGILAERSSLSAAQIKRKSDRRDWWLGAGEALEHGFVDEIVGAPALGVAA